MEPDEQKPVKLRPFEKVEKAIWRHPRFEFGNVVVVADGMVGVVCKIWGDGWDSKYHYEVYVRSLNGIKEYYEDDMIQFPIGKELDIANAIDDSLLMS